MTDWTIARVQDRLELAADVMRQMPGVKPQGHFNAWRLVLDSDMLFFKKPLEMINNIDKGNVFFMSDYQDAYSYPVECLNSHFGIGIKAKINAGLVY